MYLREFIMNKKFTFFIYDVIHAVDKVANTYSKDEMYEYQTRLMVAIVGVLTIASNISVIFLSLIWKISSFDVIYHTILTLAFYFLLMLIKNLKITNELKIHLASLICGVEYLTIFFILYEKLTFTYWFTLLLIIIPIIMMSDRIMFIYIIGVSILTFGLSVGIYYYSLINIDYSYLLGAFFVFFLITLMLLGTKIGYSKVVKSRVDNLRLISSQMEKIEIKEKELRDKNKELVKVAFYDDLSKLPNRKNMIIITNAYVESGSDFVLININVDNFKVVNDTLGHNVGDKLIQEIAKRLNNNIDKDDILGRVSGDEFVILKTAGTDKQSVEKFAKQLIELLKINFYIDNYDIRITCSAGIAMFPYDADNVDELILAIDSALYSAKHRGKNQISFYDEEMKNNLVENLKLEAAILKALERKEIYLAYQPIVSCMKGNIKSLEALARWNSKELGNISPAVFIPIAEKTGAIVDIGKFIIEESVAMVSRLEKEFGLEIKMSINLSILQLKKSNFVEEVLEITRKNGVNPSSVIFELTESLFLDNDIIVVDAISQLRDLGFYIAIDDFGTGYSSLSYLVDIPTNILKIDKTFIDGVGSSSDKETLVGALVQVAHSLDMNVTCEGVEEREQVDFLRSISCNYIQGYYFSKPLSESDLRKWIIEREENRKIKKLDIENRAS